MERCFLVWKETVTEGGRLGILTLLRGGPPRLIGGVVIAGMSEMDVTVGRVGKYRHPEG